MEKINESIFEEKYYVRELPIQAFKNLINDSDDPIIHSSHIKIMSIKKIREYIYLKIKTIGDEGFAHSYFNSVYNVTSFYNVNLYHKLLSMGFKPE